MRSANQSTDKLLRCSECGDVFWSATRVVDAGKQMQRSITLTCCDTTDDPVYG